MAAADEVAGAFAVVDAGSGIVVSLGHAALFHHRVRQRDSRQQAPGVGMNGVRKNFFRGTRFQQVAQMEHTDTVGDVLDRKSVV